MISALTSRCTFDLCRRVSAEGQRVRSDEQHRQLAEHQSENGQDQTFVLGLVQEVGGAATPTMKNETASKVCFDQVDQEDSPEDAGGSSGESSAQLVFAAENRQNQKHDQLQERGRLTLQDQRGGASKIKAVVTLKVVELTHRNGQHADVEEHVVHRGVTW